MLALHTYRPDPGLTSDVELDGRAIRVAAAPGSEPATAIVEAVQLVGGAWLPASVLPASAQTVLTAALRAQWLEERAAEGCA